MKSRHKVLNCSGTDLQTEELENILEELKNGSFEVVRFINCNLGDKEAERIAAVIKEHCINKNLRKMKLLDLRENHILTKGKSVLHKATQDHPRLELDLRSNEIKKAAAPFIVDLNKSIEKMLSQSLAPVSRVEEKKDLIEKEAAAAIAHETPRVEPEKINIPSMISVSEPLTPKESEKVPVEVSVENDWILLKKAQFWEKNGLFVSSFNKSVSSEQKNVILELSQGVR